jgi:hypothetical protein
MRRAVTAAMLLALGMPGAAAALPVGLGSSPTPAFSLRLGVGLGYGLRELDNGREYRDSLRRLTVLGRVSAMVHDRVEVIGFFHGADGDRHLADFQGRMGMGGGGGARVWALLQEQAGVNLGLGAVYGYTENRGTTGDDDRRNRTGRHDDWLKEHQLQVDLVLSRRVQNWTVYGGALFDRVWLKQTYPSAIDEALYGPLGKAKGELPVGIVVGIDYFVTPLVFFSLEGQNFHEDALYASIGLLIAP